MLETCEKLKSRQERPHMSIDSSVLPVVIVDHKLVGHLGFPYQTMSHPVQKAVSPALCRFSTTKIHDSRGTYTSCMSTLSTWSLLWNLRWTSMNLEIWYSSRFNFGGCAPTSGTPMQPRVMIPRTGHILGFAHVNAMSWPRVHCTRCKK